MKILKIILRSPLALFRLVLVVVFTFLMYVTLVFVLFVHKKKPVNTLWHLMNFWCRYMLTLIGVAVDLEIEGEMDKPGLILSNHRSYIDIFINLSLHSARIIAKREIGSWPLIGYGLRAFDALLLDRSSIASRMESIRIMEEVLKNNESLIVYPEGTTHRGPELGPIKESTYRIAANNNSWVYPVAIEYKNQDDAWIGKELFVPHFIRRSGAIERHVAVRVGAPFRSTDGKELKEYVEGFLRDRISKIRNNYDRKE
ncbi:MAG: 1-acyl-sn-glycerol-3-phosphate acyltransferase [Salinivirgaceae bacterium]